MTFAEMVRRGVGIAAGVLLAFVLPAESAWAAGNFVDNGAGEISYVDDEGNPAVSRWIYEDQENVWYYLDEKGLRASGRRELAGETYFFGEDGKMLTGWVSCPRGETPEPYTGTLDEEDIYFCHEDGRMASGWVDTYSPEQSVFDEREIFEGVQEDEYHTNRYYFTEKGRLSRGEKKTVDGRRYIFGEDAACMTGWIYDRGEGAADRYLQVDTDSPDGDKDLCREAPENLMYGSREDGSLAAGQWVDAIPPWDEEDDDTRSFYADSSGYIVTSAGAKGSGASWLARRKAVKIAEIGTYRLEDWSTDVNVTKIGGKYYCLEDSGTRMDGMLYLSGAGREKNFPDGLYCFMDNAAMKTGPVVEENTDGDDDDRSVDGYLYYYYFAEDTDSKNFKGRAVTGVQSGRLYYHGLSVGAQDDTFEVVYLPVIEEQDESGYGTGFFLVDQTGRVKKGSEQGTHYKSSDGNEYRVKKENDRNDKYGYLIDYWDGEKDDGGHKVWKDLGEQDYDYICWDAVEE